MVGVCIFIDAGAAKLLALSLLYVIINHRSHIITRRTIIIRGVVWKIIRGKI